MIRILIFILFPFFAYSQCDYLPPVAIASVGTNSSIGVPSSSGVSVFKSDTLLKSWDLHGVGELYNNAGIPNTKAAFQNPTAQRFVINVIGNSIETNDAILSGGIKRWAKDNGSYLGFGYQGASSLHGNPLGRWMSSGGDLVNLRRQQTVPQGNDILYTSRLFQTVGSFISFNALPNNEFGHCENVDIYFEKGTGDFEYFISSTGQTFFVENSTGSGLDTIQYHHASIEGFNVRVTNLEPDFIMYGIIGHNDGNGMLVNKIAVSGEGIPPIEDVSQTQIWQDFVQFTDPSLSMITLGSNYIGLPTFVGYDTSPEGNANDLELIGQRIQANSNSEILIMSPHHSESASTQISHSLYAPAFYQKAIANNWGYMSRYDYFDSSDENLRNGTTRDVVHMNNTVGACRMFDLFKHTIELE